MTDDAPDRRAGPLRGRRRRRLDHHQRARPGQRADRRRCATASPTLFHEASADLRRAGRRARAAAGERHFCTGAALGGAAAAGAAAARGRARRAVGDAARHDPHRAGSSSSRRSSTARSRSIARRQRHRRGRRRQLVLACDLVVMADTARLIEVFVRRGIMPDAGGAYLLPRLVGLHRAKELMFLGDDCPRPRPSASASRTASCPRPSSTRRSTSWPTKFLAPADPGARADQVARQPQLRVEPRAELRRRGRLPGAGHRDGRHGRRAWRLPRAPPARVHGAGSAKP